MWIYPLLAVLVTGTMMAAVAIGLFGRGQVLAGLFGPLDLRPIDFASLEKTARPNQYLVCPAGRERAACDAVSPEFDISAAELRDRWQALMATQPRLTVVPSDAHGQGDDADEWQQTFVQRSRVCAFPDLITVRFEPLAEHRSTLWIYSRSAYGRYDWGVNKRRVTNWLTALSNPQSAASPGDTQA